GGEFVRAILRCQIVQVLLQLADLAYANIFIKAQIVMNKILKNHSDVMAHRFQIIFAQVLAIEKNASFSGIIKARQELSQCGFSSAVLAYQGNFVSWPDAEAYMPERPCAAAGIAESNIFEHHSRGNRRRY